MAHTHHDPVVVERSSGNGIAIAILAIVIVGLLALVAFLAFVNLDAIVGPDANPGLQNPPDDNAPPSNPPTQDPLLPTIPAPAGRLGGAIPPA